MKKRISGFSVLISVMLVSTVAFSVALSLTIVSVVSVQNTQALQHTYIARNTAFSCSEELFLQLIQRNGNIQNGTLLIGEHTCSYTVDTLGVQGRSLHITGTKADINQTIDVVVDSFESGIIIRNWEES